MTLRGALSGALSPDDLDRALGFFPSGQHGAITDVPGVRVGHRDVIAGDDIRTGVTAILPHSGNLMTDPVSASIQVINGFGKATGLAQVGELGVLETPLVLTNTLAVGTAWTALVEHAMARSSELGRGGPTVNPVVLECNDAPLNDIRALAVTTSHVHEALAHAAASPDRADVPRGAVGAGVGMTCFGWKGGIGSASRLVTVPAAASASAVAAGMAYTVGVLVLTNMGRPDALVVLGDPVGRRLTPPPAEPADGSVIVVIATDAPLDARQLGRLGRRAGFGLARTGNDAAHGSGEFVVAFSTTHGRGDRGLVRDDPRTMNRLFTAVTEAVAEAVWDSLASATTTVGRERHTVHALPMAEVGGRPTA